MGMKKLDEFAESELEAMQESLADEQSDEQGGTVEFSLMDLLAQKLENSKLTKEELKERSAQAIEFLQQEKLQGFFPVFETESDIGILAAHGFAVQQQAAKMGMGYAQELLDC